MERVRLSDNLEMSRLVHGSWRLGKWNITEKGLLDFILQCIDLGVTTFDHADIYGDYSCEEFFGRAMSAEKGLRNKIELVTKCGIKPLSARFPDRKVKHYDYSSAYIIGAVNNSLSYFKTDYIDLFLLHRPSPFLNPEEVAKAFAALKKDGKVRSFGVSNFNHLQYEMLNAYLDVKLVTNQVEISPYCLEHFENGNIDFFLKEKINLMAWSPLAGGILFSEVDEKSKRINQVLRDIADELNVAEIGKVIYAWILNHPAKIIPIIGSGKIERVKAAVEALKLELVRENWFRVYVASTGKDVA